MQIGLGCCNRSGRRRLRVQVRPGVEMETETGGWPAASAAEHRPEKEMVGMAPCGSHQLQRKPRVAYCPWYRVMGDINIMTSDSCTQFIWSFINFRDNWTFCMEVDEQQSLQCQLGLFLYYLCSFLIIDSWLLHEATLAQWVKHNIWFFYYNKSIFSFVRDSKWLVQFMKLFPCCFFYLLCEIIHIRGYTLALLLSCNRMMDRNVSGRIIGVTL